MRKQNSIKKALLSIGAIAALVFGQSCTDLDPQFSDSVSNETEAGDFAGVADVPSSLTALYDNIENLGGQDNEYALMEVAAENIAVLTRGADWGDNGVWRLLHNHKWNAGHLYVLNSWNRRNQEILNATRFLDPASGAPADAAAQARVLRAINMFMVLNLYGQVPFRGVNEGSDVNPIVLTPQEAFDFILDDLNSAIDSGALHSSGPVVSGDGLQFVIGEAAARFIRAKVNLNSVSILGAAPAGAMDAVISDVDAIGDLGFALDLGTGDYFDIWRPATNTEVIYWMNTGTGNRVMNMIHPLQSGWNGFVTLTETFRLFGTEDVNDDARLGLAGPDFMGVSTGYLRGQQFDGAGVAMTDRQNNPLIYENELLTSLEINNERNGIRVVKYPQRRPDNFPNGGTNSEAVWLRFGEAVLMRAEAALRGGTGTGANPTADVNALRNRAGAAPLGSVALQDVYDETRRELNSEANIAGARAVQLRFGTFADTWELKNVQDDFRVLFPIPTTALASNPNLVQNPGY